MDSPRKEASSSTTASPAPLFHSNEALPYRQSTSSRSRYNPREWTWKTWLAIAVVSIIVIVAAVVGGVLGAKANAYPDHSKITYRLQDTYEGSDFFDNFNYFTGYDPTHGFVHYVDAAGSTAQNLTTTTTSNATNTTTAILRVDTSDKNATTGRRSVRITSKATYASGLFIFDVLHSPYGCGTWPALWMVDPSNWPANGEIDIMEGVNVADTGNQVTLHTSKGCKIGKSRKRRQSGKALAYDCWNATNGNEGCGVQGEVDTMGEAFNNAGGGVYAMELRSEGIRVWVFKRGRVPADIEAKNPDPSSWGTALADFPNLECDIGNHFRNQSIVANIALCGDWAGRQNIFGANSMCTGTCSEWVATQADSFEQAYWEFGGFWAYEAATQFSLQ